MKKPLLMLIWYIFIVLELSGYTLMTILIDGENDGFYTFYYLIALAIWIISYFISTNFVKDEEY